jgi:tetratricopeptide repeat protein
LERVLEACGRVLGEDHPDTRVVMHNLGLTLRALGELRAARALQEQVLDARRRLLGEEHRDTLLTQRDLAATLDVSGE